ncbi:hypothetical protein SAMN06265348_113219 [Pedobacter westerhofensis]|uniref:Uncharacterized protein n=1 Tax=Pedobacter westerhofensis TaxID=425512 RepID=A0A521FLK7_9SPHI|nr:hypothetical protein [Pedobacter westerhofensis]SMO97029.1 hypothetical protein SAMN06265348_113219 [Pedobacter westerhofensis]
MEKYTLYKTEIEGRYREIEIYPKSSSVNEYLIHWDGFEVGTIQKRDEKWFTNSVDLLPVVNEIGEFIDAHGVST